MKTLALGPIASAIKNWEGVDVGSLTTPLDIEDGGVLKAFHRVMTALGVLVIALLAVGAVAPLRVTSNVVGQVIPEGSILPINHLEGGIVSAIDAKAGTVVEKGATILRLSPVGAASESDQLASKKAFLGAQRLRFEALINNTPPDYAALGKTYPKIAIEESQTYEQERVAFDQSTEGLRSRLAQRIATRDAVAKQLTASRRSRKLLEEQSRASKSLLEQGFAARQDDLQIESAFINAQIEVTRLEGEYAAAKEAALESQHALEQLYAEKKAEWHSKASEIEAQLFELSALSLRSADRVERLEVRAPRRAVVQEVRPKAPGEVIRPGDVIATLLPLGESIVAEIKMRPEDAGHVKIGQKARVQITSFDPGLYGQIDGEVLYISPTTFTDEKGGTFFKATISLGAHQLKRGRKKYEILPGMMVQANIVTDQRSVLSYLLKPVNRAFQNAMTER